MSNASIASRIELLKTESAFKILARANELEASGRSIIHCEIGQPDFKTPENIIKAGCDAMNSGFTGYTPSPGFIKLREAIAEFYSVNKNVPSEADEVVVVPGGKPVMFFTTQMLVNPGDEVIYPDPGFPIYHSCIAFSGGVPVPVPLRADNDFRFDLEVFRNSITPKTKLVILNSPSNPTGGVFSKEDINAIADILRDRPDIFILSDEIYDRLVYDDAVAPSIAAVPGFKDRTVILNGFSKAYSMTGWRLGYGIMNRELAKAMELLMVNSNSCAASFTQIAAIEALKGPQDSVEYMKNAFMERRDWLITALNSIPGISCCMPKGAFYAFPDISSFGLSSLDFCNRLLEEGGVAASWGSSFGENGEGHIRLSYANSLENLKAAVDRLYVFSRGLR
ncbi:MAG: pyridoxal phosphate-dependent aminotransferase [Eubacteriales bacterium]|nr:pyridoxal phosphate-dependent aminotransferase [Eubacteriales bacterium]